MKWWHRAAVVWMAAALACMGFVGLRFAQGSPVESDLLALLPPTERSANAEAAVTALYQRLGSRAIFLVGHADAAKAKALARDFSAKLRQSGAFSSVLDRAPGFDPRLITETYGPYRGTLLTRADRALLAKPSFDPTTYLLRQLYQPFRAGVPTDINQDPFGFLQHWLSSLPLAQSALSIEDGVLLVRDQSRTYVLVLAEPAGSAFASETQTKVVAAVKAAEAGLRLAAPEADLLRAGSLFYGEAARSSAQAEVDLIGGGSLIGILLLMWALFRSVRPLVLGMATVAIGVSCGMAAVLASHGSIHLITLVFGASLIGEAIDYAIQYFAAHLEAGDTWEPNAGLRRVLPGLTVALATSLVGYGALSLTPFPAVSQIATFAFVGLGAAWLSVVLLLPRFVPHGSKRNVDQSIRLPRRILSAWRRRMTPSGVLVLSIALLAISVPGWLRLVTDDNVRMLVSRPANLVLQENAIRRLAGIGGGGRFFLVEGSSDEEALQHEEALTDRLSAKVGHGISGFSAISDFVPSIARQRRNRDLLNTAIPPDRAGSVLAAQGFRQSAIDAWAEAINDTRSPLTLATWRTSTLATPVQHQILPPTGTGTALLLTLNGDDGTLDLEAIAAGMPAVTVVDKAGSVSALFAKYRGLAALWLPAALAIVLAILVYRYGLRTGVAVLVPTLLAMAVAMATYGYAGVPLTLFSMMGLLLLLGIGVNYAIFVVEAGDRAPAPFAGALLSASTTILSFGLLSLSGMPALRQFGLVLLSGVSCSILLAPIALTLGKRPCA